MDKREMIPCSDCGDLILIKEDEKHQKPKCSRCVSQKNSKKELDKEKDNGMIECIGCGRKYSKHTDPYSKPRRCANCYDEHGRLYWWK